MADGRLDTVRLTRRYLDRIERLDPLLHAVIEVNPDAVREARRLDAEPRPRGPLHGLPVLLKDMVETADRMHTTAGSLALLGLRPARDATVAARLRAAGAVILGKTNLSQWAGGLSITHHAGWSARGGQTRNPYKLDRSPNESSSGTAAAASRGHLHRDCTRFLDAGGLRGARVGVPRKVYFGYSDHADEIAERAVGVLRDAGATVVDPADIPTAERLEDLPSSMVVQAYEVKPGGCPRPGLRRERVPGGAGHQPPARARRASTRCCGNTAWTRW